ncbi:MAG: transcription-repair coupling factor [Bryobacteraceae bacterium]
MTHPAVRDLLLGLGNAPGFRALVRELALSLERQENSLFRAAGMNATGKALYLVLLWQSVQRPLVVVVDGSKRAEELSELTAAFFDALVLSREGHFPQMIPALDVLATQNLSPHSEIAEQRAIGLLRLARGAAPITITPVGSALLRTETPEFHKHLAVSLKVNEDIAMEDLVTHLESIGYEKREPVEMVGEYSVRGGILDVFPAEAQHPVRVEFFGDTVESMRTFHVETQRSVLKISEVTLLPLTECPRSRPILNELGAPAGEPFAGWEFHVPRVRPRKSTLLDQGSGTVLVLDEPEQSKSAAERLWKRLNEPGRESPVPLEQLYLSWDELTEHAARLPRVEFRELELDAPGSWHVAARPSMRFHNNMQVAVAEARALVEQGNRVVFFSASTGEMERMADILQEYSVPFQVGLDPAEAATAPLLAARAYQGDLASVLLAKGKVRAGASFPEQKAVLFGSEDLFEHSELASDPSVRGTSDVAAFAADIGDLKPGDYVVHATHGIGQFLGIRELTQGDVKGDFMLLEYSGGAKLYVPLSRLDLIQRYRASGEGAPSLDKLGGATWEKTKSKVKARMRDMAEELLKLYAQRKMAEGFAYSPDSNWQREFEDAFEYTETKDQLRAIEDIKRDMESPHPMDRLLCGDVGYGKTEVAMRAVFKALGDGKQVAVLAPTTVLCFQHYETFKRRFAPFPAKVEMFNRFRSAKELKASVEELAEGKIDIAVGTHRLLSPDVHFRDLGLVIIDEEQRFGVKHKEKLKQLRKSVDVLTMSATPIPRTLHLSMLGLRDLSIIETPPKDRLAIHTVVARFNPDIVKTAIEQELARGGQVYYLHNRVESIWQRAAMIQELVPEAKVGVGHGQMDEAALEKVILGFMRHEFDVFVCTTIIENGIDIPLANTIVIEHAERHGLSELYQLRGRVGRSNRRAYAYLLVPEDTELTETARKRLAALREFSDLGAGFKIAALDLELRGAGNILGGEQHGHINAVGYDMYMSLLENAVKELRGEQVLPEIHTSVSLGLDLRIPSDWISDETQRLRAYKRIAEASDAAKAAKALEDLVDRYGPAPPAVALLLRFAVLKSAAERAGIESIERKAGAVQLKFHPDSQIDPERLMDLVQNEPGAQFSPGGILRLTPPAGADPAGLIEFLEGRVSALSPDPAAAEISLQGIG